MRGRRCMRTLIYTRVSTAGQAEGFSLVTQLELCEIKARELGPTTILHLEDTHTGVELARPAMDRLREHVRQRDVDWIVAYDPDRFSRNLSDLLIVTREIDAAGIGLQFVNFDWKNTPQGTLFLQLRGAIAQFEHALIKERTIRGKRKKAALGKLRTHAPTYGYRFNRDRDELEIDPETAPVVRRIFDLYTACGLSSYQIAGQLERAGFLPPRGPVWRASSICRMLRNETYAGRLRRKDEQSDWKPLLTPIIIDRKTFELAQRILDQNRRRARATRRYDFLVQTIIRCGLCGRVMRGSGRTHKGRSYTYYTCPGRYEREGESCRLPPARADLLDRAVWDAIASTLSAQAFLEQLDCRTIDERQRLESELTGLSERRKRLCDARDRINRAHFMGHISADEYDRHIGECEKTMREAAQQIAVRARILTRLSAGDPATARYAADLAEAVATLPFDRRQAICRCLIHQVRLFPGNLVELIGSAGHPFLTDVSGIEKRAVRKLGLHLTPPHPDHS